MLKNFSMAESILPLISVSAEVCLHCGERLYSEDTVKRFEEIRVKLVQEQTADFQPMGQAFQANS